METGFLDHTGFLRSSEKAKARGERTTALEVEALGRLILGQRLTQLRQVIKRNEGSDLEVAAGLVVFNLANQRGRDLCCRRAVASRPVTPRRSDSCY
jgi:hypothetical protein